MVAVIHTGKSLTNILHYNEQKVSDGRAELIHSHHFAKDTEWLSWKDKIGTFQKLASLNNRTKTNAVHISLNFNSSDKLNGEKLKRIVDNYMQQIGFGDQPFLVYQHHDAGHPHLHIVTTNIRYNRSRIPLHNIGRNQSEKARKNIEQSFGLIPAQQPHKRIQLTAGNAQKVQYGRSETKEAIEGVLDVVIPHYKYASLGELNAVLKQYNVMADGGSEKSAMFKHGGLVYRILNDEGRKRGVPLKASLLRNQPTLAFLQAQFVQNRVAKQGHQTRVKNAVDFSLSRNERLTLPTLQQRLEKMQISIAIRPDKSAKLQKIFYVDYKAKCVFTGSELGTRYSAKSVVQRCKQITLVEPIADEWKQKRKKQQHH